MVVQTQTQSDPAKEKIKLDKWFARYMESEKACRKFYQESQSLMKEIGLIR